MITGFKQLDWFSGIQLSPAANRILHAVIAVLMGGVLVVCAVLQPNPAGRGTHEQLGLPGCLVCKVTGWQQCPSCGLTTAFCHIMHGNFSQAQACHSASCWLFVGYLIVTGYCLFIIFSRKQWLAYEIAASCIALQALLVLWVAAGQRMYR